MTDRRKSAAGMRGREPAQRVATPGGRSARMGRRGLGLSLLCGAVVFAVFSPAGCAPEPKDAVVSIKGWSLNLTGLEEAYNHVKGADAFATASIQEREAFARTLADKEILLRLSRKASPSLTGKQARIFRITYEKNLQRDYLKYRRDLYKLDAAQLEHNMPLVSRAATLRVARLLSKEVAPEAHAAVEAGQSFEQIVAKYGAPMAQAPTVGGPPVPAGQPQPWQEVTVRIDDPRSPPSLIMQGLLRDLPEGGMAGPIEGQGQILLIKVVKYTPLPEAADAAFAQKVKMPLENIGYMSVNQAWSDSLRKASGFAIHREAYATIVQRMAAYWDSLDAVRVKGGTTDFQSLRAPVWLFNADERKQPLFDLWGKTWTVGDYVESLNDIDLDYWPTVGDLAKVSFQIDSRIYRLLFHTAAERAGYPQRPEFVEKMKKIEEEGFLNQYFAQVGGKEAEPSPEQIKVEYEKNPDSFKSTEQVSFSVLSYPKNKKARAEAMIQRLRAAGPLAWFDLAPAEAKADTSVKYLQPTDLMDTGRPAPVANWTPFMLAAKGHDQGHICDLVPTVEGYSIVRVQNRLPERRMTLEQASSSIARNLADANREQLIEKTLADARKSYGVKVHLDRLGQAEKAGM